MTTEILDKDKWPAFFPDKPAASADEIGRRMGGLKFEDREDERRHFTLLAPLGWRLIENGEGPSPPGLLVSLVLGAPRKAEIAVFVDDVPREVSPAEWTIHRLEQAGHTLWAKREEYTPIGAMADLLTRREDAQGTFIARTNMAKDGKRIFTITCQAREDEYERLADDFCVTLATFKLLHPERAPLAEPLSSYCYLWPVVTGFSYPESFRLDEEALSDTEYDVRLDNLSGDKAAGSIHVSARLDASPRRLLAALHSKLQRLGAVFDDRPALEPEGAPKGFTEASSVAWTGSDDGGDIELSAIAFSTDKATVLVSTWGPTRARAATDWMVQKRAFEIVRDTVYVV
jgi:hypothetical protein